VSPVEIVPHDAPDLVARATALLDAGELAILPLDGAYALCADALQDEAAERVFSALERSADAPLPVLVAGYEDLHHVAFPTPTSRALADAFWPGPLTMLLRARPWLPDAVTAAQETVPVRAPRVEITRRLAAHFGPLLAVDLPSPDAVREARLRVDAGPRSGREDTWVDATGAEAKVLREGAVRAAEVTQRGR